MTTPAVVMASSIKKSIFNPAQDFNRFVSRANSFFMALICSIPIYFRLFYRSTLSRRLPPSCRPQLPRWRSHQLNRALTRVNLSPDRPTHVPANAEDSTLNKSRLSKQSNRPKLNRKNQLFISIYFITQITTVSFTGWRWQRYPFRSKRDAVLNLMRNQKSLHHRKCLKLKRTPVATAKSGLSSLQSLRQLQPIPSALLLWLRLLHLLELQPHRYRVYPLGTPCVRFIYRTQFIGFKNLFPSHVISSSNWSKAHQLLSDNFPITYSS